MARHISLTEQIYAIPVGEKVLIDHNKPRSVRVIVSQISAKETWVFKCSGTRAGMKVERVS